MPVPGAADETPLLAPIVTLPPQLDLVTSVNDHVVTLVLPFYVDVGPRTATGSEWRLWTDPGFAFRVPGSRPALPGTLGLFFRVRVDRMFAITPSVSLGPGVCLSTGGEIGSDSAVPGLEVALRLGRRQEPAWSLALRLQQLLAGPLMVGFGLSLTTY